MIKLVSGVDDINFNETAVEREIY